MQQKQFNIASKEKNLSKKNIGCPNPSPAQIWARTWSKVATVVIAGQPASAYPPHRHV